MAWPLLHTLKEVSPPLQVHHPLHLQDEWVLCLRLLLYHLVLEVLHLRLHLLLVGKEKGHLLPLLRLLLVGKERSHLLPLPLLVGKERGHLLPLPLLVGKERGHLLLLLLLVENALHHPHLLVVRDLPLHHLLVAGVARDHPHHLD